MSLNIDNSSMKRKTSKEIIYGKLLIETTVRGNNGIIDLERCIQNTNTNSNKKELKNEKRYEKDMKSKINTKYSKELKRGEKISINSITSDISKLVVGLQWNINFMKNKEFDLDTSVFMVDDNNNTSDENFIFYGNPVSKDKGISLDKDHGCLLKNELNKVIELNLKLIPKSIKKLAFTVTIYEADKRGQNFSYVSNGLFKILDSEGKKEIINYDFTKGLKGETAVVVSEIYRYKDEWRIAPIGSGFNGGLEDLCHNYGIETTN